MVSLNLQNPNDKLEALGKRAQTRRMQLGLRQEDLARRSGVSTPTIKRFERTGEIGTLLLAKIAVVLGSLDDIDNVFNVSVASSIAELEAQERTQEKKRVRLKIEKTKK